MQLIPQAQVSHPPDPHPPTFSMAAQRALATVLGSVTCVCNCIASNELVLERFRGTRVKTSVRVCCVHWCGAILRCTLCERIAIDKTLVWISGRMNHTRVNALKHSYAYISIIEEKYYYNTGN